MKILFLITARGGSKGVPDKNLRQINGISLIGYRAIGARRCGHCSRLIISSDSEAIQQDAMSYGVEVPFRRPAELATDGAPSWRVVDHAMRWIADEARESFDAVMLLEPSSPFTRAVDYDRAVEKMATSDAEAVVGVKNADVKSVYVAPMDPEGRLTPLIDKVAEKARGQRQDGEKEYTASGGLYLFRWDYFMQHKNIYHDRLKTYGQVIEDPYSIEIDHLVDLAYAEFLVERGYIDGELWAS